MDLLEYKKDSETEKTIEIFLNYIETNKTQFEIVNKSENICLVDIYLNWINFRTKLSNVVSSISISESCPQMRVFINIQINQFTPKP